MDVCLRAERQLLTYAHILIVDVEFTSVALLGFHVLAVIESMGDLGKDHISKRNRATRLARTTDVI